MSDPTEDPEAVKALIHVYQVLCTLRDRQPQALAGVLDEIDLADEEFDEAMRWLHQRTGETSPYRPYPRTEDA